MNLTDAIHMAVKFANQGKLEQAEKKCRDIIAANDKYHPAYHLLGQLAYGSGKDQLAAEMLHMAVQLNGSSAPYKRDLAEVLCISDQPTGAMTFVEQALKLEASDAKTHYIAAMALTKLGASEQAIEAYNTVIKLNPDHGAAYNNLGTLLEASGDVDKAKDAYYKAIKINKKHVEAQNNLGSVLVEEGDIESAIKHFEAAIMERPAYIEAHHNLSALKHYKKHDQHSSMLKEIAKDASTLSGENRIRLDFTLGKLYSDIQNYNQAFEYYKSGNKAKRASFDYNEQATEKFSENIETVFSKSYFKKTKRSDHDALSPVFVVGMPRSGSTLIEQIISSHSQAFAGGELLVLANIIKSKINNFPQGIKSLPDEELRLIGDEYLHYIKNLNPDARRIIDKMPANYQYAGLIAKILPGAHIINATRNPMDCCLSIYRRLFIQTLKFGYDLGELGRYYNRYQHLMDHWHNVLPEGILVSVNYEDVVADLGREARKLIDFIGLEWEDACLDFYKNNTQVKTASAAQVRQPIYNTSIEKWRPFEKHLGVLLKALAETLNP